MQQYKVDLGAIEATPRTSDSGGGCVTFTFAEQSGNLGDNGGSTATSAWWRTRSQVNLIQFNMTGTWYNIDTADEFHPFDPMVVELQDESGAIASLTLTESGYVVEGDMWTGVEPIAAGTLLRVYIYGGGAYDEFLAEDVKPSWSRVCISAWFDGESGGGLIMYPESGV